MTPGQATTFEEQLTSSFQDLRKSLAALITACGTRAAQPQQMARDLEVSRNLTWKFSKVLCSNDLYEAMQHLPGDEGVEIMIRAAGNKGIDSALAEAVRDSLAAFNQVVEVHSGDRATLELMIDGWGARGSSDRLEQSRKLAFRGNCGIWGAQARVRAQMCMVAPNDKSPDMLDLALIGGVVGFRRFRPNLRWPLFRPRMYHDDGTPLLHSPGEAAIDPAYAKADGPRLLSNFCSPNLPEIRLVKEAGGWAYEIAEGPVGNTGAFDCFNGTVTRSVANRYATPGDEHGDFSTMVTLPTEWLQADLLIHRDLGTPDGLETSMFGQMGSGELGTMRIPFDEEPREMSGRPPSLVSSQIERFDSLAEYVFDRLGWSALDFRAWRLLLRYPPMHSTVRLRWNLPTRPA